MKIQTIAQICTSPKLHDHEFPKRGHKTIAGYRLIRTNYGRDYKLNSIDLLFPIITETMYLLNMHLALPSSTLSNSASTS